MSKDTIYLQDAIDLFDVPDADGMFTSCGHAMRELRKLPPAQSEPQWIPCSDSKRLPDYREPVLVSTYWGVRMAERDAVKEDGTDDFWYLFLDDATAHPRYVYAWMPLPTDYQGE